MAEQGERPEDWPVVGLGDNVTVELREVWGGLRAYLHGCSQGIALSGTKSTLRNLALDILRQLRDEGGEPC